MEHVVQDSTVPADVQLPLRTEIVLKTEAKVVHARLASKDVIIRQRHSR